MRPSFPERAKAGASALALREYRSLVRIAWEASDQAGYFHGFIAGYARSSFTAGTTDKVLLASQELLENAQRYSVMTKPIVYQLEIDASEVRVSVENATITSRASLLQEQLRRIERDPEGTYAAELERSMNAAGRRSMLGLVRICHEAGMSVTATVKDVDVRVMASARR